MASRPNWKESWVKTRRLEAGLGSWRNWATPFGQAGSALPEHLHDASRSSLKNRFLSKGKTRGDFGLSYISILCKSSCMLPCRCFRCTWRMQLPLGVLGMQPRSRAFALAEPAESDPLGDSSASSDGGFFFFSKWHSNMTIPCL